MGKEIEKKFLVDHAKWLAMKEENGELYRQGYLVTDPGKTIRVRLTPTAAYLTIKGLTVGATRQEYEYAIPQQDAVELLDCFAVAELTKTRYKVWHQQHDWEVDEFAGENTGLIIAEIELQHEAETFDSPEWIGEEVTGEEKYYNANLTRHPYKGWL